MQINELHDIIGSRLQSEGSLEQQEIKLAVYQVLGCLTRKGDETSYYFDTTKNLDGKWDSWRQVVDASGNIVWDDFVSRSKRKDSKSRAETLALGLRKRHVGSALKTSVSASSLAGVRIRQRFHARAQSRQDELDRRTIASATNASLLAELLKTYPHRAVGGIALFFFESAPLTATIFDRHTLQQHVIDWQFANNAAFRLFDVTLDSRVQVRAIEFSDPNKALLFKLNFNAGI